MRAFEARATAVAALIGATNAEWVFWQFLGRPFSVFVLLVNAAFTFSLICGFYAIKAKIRARKHLEIPRQKA